MRLSRMRPDDAALMSSVRPMITERSILPEHILPPLSNDSHNTAMKPYLALRQEWACRVVKRSIASADAIPPLLRVVVRFGCLMSF